MKFQKLISISCVFLTIVMLFTACNVDTDETLSTENEQTEAPTGGCSHKSLRA